VRRFSSICSERRRSLRPQAGFDLSNQIGAASLYGNSGGTLE
jgi:hypothetical protein